MHGNDVRSFIKSSTSSYPIGKMKLTGIFGIRLDIRLGSQDGSTTID